MDSTVIAQNYSNSNSTKYGVQIIELASETVTYENNIGNFKFPYVTPTMAGNDTFDQTLPKNNTSNIINKSNNLGLVRITTSNYITLTIPRHLFTIKEIITHITPNASFGGEGYYVSCSPVATNTIVYNPFVKGNKFLVVNLAGNVNKPYIIGVA